MIRDENGSGCEGIFLGSVTVGERGQFVIPADIRKELGIHGGDRLLCFRHPMGQGLMISKVDSVQDVIRFFQSAIASYEETPSAGGPSNEEKN